MTEIEKIIDKLKVDRETLVNGTSPNKDTTLKDIDDNYEVNINSTNNVNSELPSVTKVNINIK